jgi:hypothetical protein
VQIERELKRSCALGVPSHAYQCTIVLVHNVKYYFRKFFRLPISHDKRNKVTTN